MSVNNLELTQASLGLNEADTCRTLITPNLQAAGWEVDPHSIAEARHVTGQSGAARYGKGPKDRNVTARPEGPGYAITKNSQGLKGRSNDLATHVPPLQGARQFVCTYSRAFSPGYNRAGFQPYPSNALKLTPISHDGNVNEIIGKFGGADQFRTAVNELQSLLYAD